MVNDVVHFSGVIGAIKCTYVRIICPNTKENVRGIQAFGILISGIDWIRRNIYSDWLMLALNTTDQS